MLPLLLIGGLQSGADQGLCISVRNRDKISQLHVESTLRRMKLTYGVFAGLSIGYYVPKPPSGFVASLNKIAPPTLFSIYISGQRNLSDDLPSKDWVTIKEPGGICPPLVPFPFQEAVKLDGIPVSEVVSARYLRRPFLCPDFKERSGYEIRLSTEKSSRRLQVYDTGSGWNVLDEEPVNKGPIPLESAKQ